MEAGTVEVGYPDVWALPVAPDGGIDDGVDAPDASTGAAPAVPGSDGGGPPDEGAQ